MKRISDTYMDFILDRYHDASNIVWIVGGDVSRGCRIPACLKEWDRE